MNKINNKRNVIIVLLLLISIGFAYLSTNLNIIGASIVHGNTWQVIWDDTSVDVISGSVTANTPTVDSNKTTVSYDITLNSPGDYYEFSVDAFNNGSINAMVSLITFTYKENNSTVTLPSCIKHTVKYADGRDVEMKDLLEAGQKQKYYINIEYDRNVTTSNMISTNRTFTVTIKVTYEQADNTAVAKEINSNTICLNNKHLEITSNTVCKRATTLHTDKCLIEDENKGCRLSDYSLNDDIIYGTCGTLNTLTSGDAFDCDVDGNGTYDEDERFYYVSPKDAEENSKYATLIYYKSLQNDKYNDELINYLGPKKLLNYLPSTDAWPKVELTNNGVRQIKTVTEKVEMDDGTSIPLFSYTGRAARLLTSNEIKFGCEPENSSIGFTVQGYLKKCEYLLEDTYFSNLSNNSAWYLENISPNLINIGYTVYAPYVSLGGVGIDNRGFVRPAIEVPLKNISY